MGGFPQCTGNAKNSNDDYSADMKDDSGDEDELDNEEEEGNDGDRCHGREYKNESEVTADFLGSEEKYMPYSRNLGLGL